MCRLGLYKGFCSSCSAGSSVCHLIELARKQRAPLQHQQQAMRQVHVRAPVAATAAGACISSRQLQMCIAAGAARCGRPRAQQQQLWLQRLLATLAAAPHQHGRNLLLGPIRPVAAAAGWVRPSSSGSATCSRRPSSSSTGCCKPQKLSRCDTEPFWSRSRYCTQLTPTLQTFVCRANTHAYVADRPCTVVSLACLVARAACALTAANNCHVMFCCCECRRMHKP